MELSIRFDALDNGDFFRFYGVKEICKKIGYDTYEDKDGKIRGLSSGATREKVVYIQNEK